MATNKEIIDYILEQTNTLDNVIAKKMFGEYGLYCNNKFIGVICTDELFIKPTKAGESILKEIILKPPYKGASNYFLIEDIDDSDYLCNLFVITAEELPEPKKKK